QNRGRMPASKGTPVCPRSACHAQLRNHRNKMRVLRDALDRTQNRLLNKKLLDTMRNHPTIPNLKISLGGNFTYKDKPLAVREHQSHGKTIQTVTIKSIIRSAPKLVLETYRPKPKDG